MMNIIPKERCFELFHTIKNPPKKLYAKGNIDLLNKTCFSVIGSRNATKYGEEMTKKFVKELIKYDVCIVSGLAIGIDSFSHIATLENGGNTIAVLPCGLENIFPEENKGLANTIIKNNGLLLSEYAKNTKASYNKFLQRNRLVSGLGVGTLVIEAGHRSGTTVTARITQEQKKLVFCVPNRLGEIYGVGTNRLIQNGAKLVMSANDIAEEYHWVKNKRKNAVKKVRNINVNSEYKNVFNVISEEPREVNLISKLANETIENTNYCLTMLELEGAIKKLPGNFFVRI